MKDALAPLDRTTLALWRTTNLVGWAALALGAALTIHWAAAEYSDRYFPQAYLNRKWEWLSGWFILPSFAFRFGVSLLIAVAVGGIVGTKAWKHQPLFAAGVATAYSLITIFAIAIYAGPVDTYRAGPQEIPVTGPTLAHGFGGYGAGGWIYDLLTLSTVPIAALCARFVAKHRVN